MSDPVTSSRRAWLPVGLGVSLLVNVLLVGVLAGMLMTSGPADHPHRSRAPEDPDRALASAVMDSLAEQERREMVNALRRAWRDVAPERKALYQRRRAISEALAADPFDRAAAEAALNAARDSEDDMRRVLQARVLDYFEALPAERRAAIIERMKRPRFRKSQDGKRSRDGEERERRGPRERPSEDPEE